MSYFRPHAQSALFSGVLADLAGFTWWSLGITIAAGLAVGYALHLGDAVLEVPISAMLILSNAGVFRPAAHPARRPCAALG